MLTIFPINYIISHLVSMGGRMAGLADMSAQLPLPSAIVLVIISIIVTMLGGMLPAKRAAQKELHKKSWSKHLE